MGGGEYRRKRHCKREERKRADFDEKKNPPGRLPAGCQRSLD